MKFLRLICLLLGVLVLVLLGFHSVLFSEEVWIDLSSGQFYGDLSRYGGSVKILRGVSMDGDYGLALRSDGTVWSWGFNYSGHLGDGTNTQRLLPVQVLGLNNIVQVSAGSSHAFALRSDGTVWAWGDNTYGQLGNGTWDNSNTPVQVQISNVRAISAGSSHSLALKDDGTVWAWGGNWNGQLGINSYIDKNLPERVAGLENVVAIVAGNGHSLALLSDGTVYSWGSNWDYQLGLGEDDSNRLTPVKLPLNDVVAIAAGANHSLFLKSDGTVWASGWNYFGQIGDNKESGAWAMYPVQVHNLSNVVAISAGSDNSYALKSDGTIWSWGKNVLGSLGDGTNINRYTPVQVSGLSSVIAIDGGDVNAIALRSDGTVWAWGDNWWGQLGNGTVRNMSYIPVQVQFSQSNSGYIVYSVNPGNRKINRLFINLGNSDYVGFLFSSDGSIWRKWNGTGWESVELGADSNGNTESEVESLGKAEWNDLLGSSGNFYIGVIIRNSGELRALGIEFEDSNNIFPDFTISSWGLVEGQAPLTVVLSADADSKALREYLATGRSFIYEWDFGDGTPKVTGKRVVGHTYKVAGNYTVTLAVKDDLNNSEPVANNNTIQVRVTQPEDMTVRHFKVYYSNKHMRVPLKVIIKPVLEYMPGLEKVQSNEWRVGTDFVAQNRSQAVITFTQPGDFNINFSGQTNYGRVLQGTFPINVKANQKPTCSIQYEDYPEYGYTKFTPSCVDPDGRVRSYLWEFGNGEVSKSRIGYAHYERGGSYTVKLRVVDDSNEEANFQWYVSVTR